MVREALTLEALGALEPREAAAYFIGRRAEGLTSGEQQLLADWLAKDEAHRRMFDSADRAWQSLDGADSDEILNAMRAHARSPRPGNLARWQPIAAAAAVLILAVTAALSLVPGLNPWSPSVETIQYASARGEVNELQLPDGSTMTLDTDSAAVGRFGGRTRTIELQRGRAYFDVKPDRSRPFAVAAGGRRIVAVGTSFDVNLAVDGLTVTLLEGKVEIGPPDSSQLPVMLSPGQQYIERLSKRTIQTIGPASQNAVTWRSGRISFDDQPLAEAAAMMNRYSTQQIVINDPAIGALRVSGQFQSGNLQGFVDSVAEVHKLRSVRQGDRIELVRQN